MPGMWPRVFTSMVPGGRGGVGLKLGEGGGDAVGGEGEGGEDFEGGEGGVVEGGLGR